SAHFPFRMLQEIRPLLAVDIIEQLHRQFALLSGGRGKDGAPIITFPEYSGFSEVPEEDFLNVVTYLTSIPRILGLFHPKLDSWTGWFRLWLSAELLITNQRKLLIQMLLRGK
uniref:Uncharacterized protein n=1 Tax=Cyprinodon variegatus TaxID=28743 RepID=A0A3Q2CWY0_CYPVA